MPSASAYLHVQGDGGVQQLCYEVTLEVEATMAAALQKYMVGKHLPDIFATGCFAEIRFVQEDPTRYRTQYWARSQAQLDDYFAHHGEAMRADFLMHFPHGVSVQRSVWNLRAEWRL